MAAGLALAGLGVARAREAPSRGGWSFADSSGGEFERHVRGPGSGRGAMRAEHHRMRFGPPGTGFGPLGRGFGAIHGEVTVPGPEDGYRTIASQRGEVTEVSRSSIELKSEDGYTRAYKVEESTLVNAGRDGIEDVKVGDQVHLAAVVEGGTARAVRIFDITNLERLGEPWRAERRSPEGGPDSGS